ncbi:MAG: Hint domain-containing protein [Loktanella sp.]|nr:Hint domain-containing protein [Loktanella sp.]
MLSPSTTAKDDSTMVQDKKQSTSHNQPRHQRYTVTYLRHGNDIGTVSHLAPAIPAFEDAFAAMGRGTILYRPEGPIAVEDVMPGNQILLRDGRYAPLLWRGSMTMPRAHGNSGPVRRVLTRITADALGVGRPMQDLILGPAARLHHHAPDIRRLTGTPDAYIPACDFVDGNQFIALRPKAAVDLYQLGFAQHETLIASGVGIESLHPDNAFNLGLRANAMSQYLALFPHLTSLEEVGPPRHPRLRLHDLDSPG